MTDLTDKRLEEKLDSMSHQLTRLMTINEMAMEQSKTTNGKVESLETDMDKQRGAIGLIKWLGGFAITGALSFGVWLVQSNSSTNDRLSDTNQKVALLESRLSRDEADIKAIMNDMKGYYDVGK